MDKEYEIHGKDAMALENNEGEFLFLAIPDESHSIHMPESAGPTKAKVYTSQHGEVFVRTTALISVGFMDTNSDQRIKQLPETIVEWMCDFSEKII